MKKLVTLIAGVVVVAGLTTAAYAQAAGPTGGGVQTGGVQGQKGQGKPRPPVAQKILKELNLTPDQMKQVRALIQKMAQNQPAAGAKPDRNQAAAGRQQFIEDLNKILTPEQQDKFKQLVALGGKAGKAGKAGALGGTAGTTGTGTTVGGVQTGGIQPGQKQKGNPRSPVGQKLLKELNLTPDQMKQVGELVKSFEQKRQQEQTAGGKPNRKEAGADRRLFMQDLAKILTPEQQEKFKQLIAQRAKGGKNGQLGGLGGTQGTTGTTGGVKTGGGGF